MLDQLGLGSRLNEWGKAFYIFIVLPVACVTVVHGCCSSEAGQGLLVDMGKMARKHVWGASRKHENTAKW
jgi:hypothetical protein